MPIEGPSLDAPEQAFQPALLQGDDGLLPVAGAAQRAAAPEPLLLATDIDRVHAPDLHPLGLVLLFEGAGDLGLARIPRDAERVAALLVQRIGALGDDRAVHHLNRRPTHR